MAIIGDEMRKVRVLSICTGVGGFELALDDRFEVVGHSEIDKHCNAVLNYHFKGVENYGDIREAKDLPDCDLIVGGTPCQDLSIAGQREGLGGGRSGLFFDFIKTIKEKQPVCFIWENVKGSLSSQDGWDFAQVQDSISNIGYDFRWNVLNSDDYGVPQARERVVIVGFNRGFSSRGKILCKTSSYRKDAYRREFDLKDSKNLIAYSKSTREKHIDHRIRINHVANTLTTGKGFGNMSTCNYVKDAIGLRHLTPLEGERLMGWPSDWTKYGLNTNGDKIIISDNQRYKMIGNGVVVPMIKNVIESIYGMK